MNACPNCGCRNQSDRATGKTTRVVLQAALDLSNGKSLYIVHGMNKVRSRELFQSIRVLVDAMGFMFEDERQGRLVTRGGGELFLSPYAVCGAQEVIDA